MSLHVFIWCLKMMVRSRMNVQVYEYNDPNPHEIGVFIRVLHILRTGFICSNVFFISEILTLK